MKKIIYICLSVILGASMISCDQFETVPTQQSTQIETSKEITIPVLTEPAPQTTEVTTTEITTTEATTTEETTTEITTTEVTTTEVTTTEKEPVAPPPPQQTTSVASVLDGEYTYGGEPIIEDINGFTYVNGILIANKTYTLPASYNPGGLQYNALSAFNQMKEDAAQEGIYLHIISGYRSYTQQNSTYNGYVARDGAAAADRYSARPGHSEHQTGYAMDINSLYQSFGNTAEGIWLANHCAEYGFIIRYPEGKEHITGFMYEPWHIRYLGVGLAKTITESGLCLEEFLGITSVYAN